ncbi:LOW QUALITY PROTEIN: beta-1,4-glucuronyltransferase 1 [Amblyraja radiata]|uniref:LOW QUALITY PROTEIN: beta-1,4-glucuronyltransferase 1 n=1 Tax=Amblyraja radiata TaxID=386614 RepID=UPI001401E91D|nr:LOW QUALITY PROTEIN: beta-1,4-glucuronyltransferase 1 [Amblyraja radiata]
MRCSPFRAAVCGLLLVAGLQLLYLGLLPGLQPVGGRRERPGPRPGPEPGAGVEAEAARLALQLGLRSGGQPEAGGRYRLYPDVTGQAGRRGRGFGPGLGLTISLGLATHSSPNNLHHLPGLTRRWQGPISLALFATQSDLSEALQALQLLVLHCPGVRELVTVTLVTPATVRPPPDVPRAPALQGGDERGGERDPLCHRALEPVYRLRGRYANYALANASYPGNLLRNAARRALPARHVAVVDVDMLPSGGLYRRLLRLLDLRPTAVADAAATVYVLPAFEIRRSRRLPSSKAELQRLYQVGEVRPFYGELCPRCQAPTNYSRWINLGPAPDLRVAYTLSWTDPWEPFYVGPSTVPPYDERFEQYGFNRISQACELHVAGFSFAVLDDAFLVHKGFKVPGEFHAQKDEENRSNRALFRQFKQELKLKYPESPRRC